MSEKISVYIGADIAEWLPMQVLMFSIKRHSSIDVEFAEINNGLVKEVIDPRYLPFTNFSYGRFAIPKLAGYQGRGIYLDSDMLVFRDITELWDTPFDGAKILTVSPGKDGGSSKKTAVMLMDCQRLPWDPNQIVDDLGVKYDYEELMSFSPLLDENEVQNGICYGWNCLDTYNNETRLLHYTNITTQPWVSVEGEWRGLWIDEVALMLNEGALSVAKIKREIATGHIRPSLLNELGLAGSGSETNKEVLKCIDAGAGYEPHKKLYERHAHKDTARIEYERSLDPDNYKKRVLKEAFREFYRHPIKFIIKKKYDKHIRRLQ